MLENVDKFADDNVHMIDHRYFYTNINVFHCNICLRSRFGTTFSSPLPPPRRFLSTPLRRGSCAAAAASPFSSVSGERERASTNQPSSSAQPSCPFRSEDFGGHTNRSCISAFLTGEVLRPPVAVTADMDGDGDFIGDNKTYMLEDTGDPDSGDGGAGGSKEPTNVLREQDRFLPIANVARIMKRGIPTNGKIAKESRECMQECVSEFVSFVTSEASDRCHQEKRKTINGEDLLFAMSVLGFDNYVEPLKLFLQKYRESMKGDKLPDQFEEMEDAQFATNTLEPIPEGSAGGAAGGMIYTHTAYGTQQF